MKWDLSPLGGPKSVVRREELPLSYIDTTFTINICEALKTGPEKEKCPGGSWGMLSFQNLHEP